MAKIGIDIRCLIEGRRTGVEEYTLNLLEHIFSTDAENEYILFLNSFQRPKADFSWLAKYPNVTLRQFRFPNKLLNFLFWYFNWPKIDQLIGGTDVFFMPNIIFGSISRQTKLVVTVHDLSFERYPETFNRKRVWWHMFINPRKIAARADRIIAVSESTAFDLRDLYGIKAEKIRVIHSGIPDFQIINRNDEKLLSVKEKYNLPYRFILYFGTIEPRKNIAAISRAYNQLMKMAEEEGNAELGKYKLVIAGSQGWLADGIFREIKRSRYRENIQVVNFVAAEDKEYFFNLASLFIYPSFFEGFGFPPLEAMKCGVPVITSNNSSLPEIVGKAGVMIDPDKPDELRRAIVQILMDRKFAEQLIAAGLENVQRFSWQKAAGEFLSLIRELTEKAK